MKRNYDSKHREKEFKVGAWVYVHLQPYRQVSVALRRNAKLAPRYYGPFQILHRKHWTGNLQVGLALGFLNSPSFSCITIKEEVGIQSFSTTTTTTSYRGSR